MQNSQMHQKPEEQSNGHTSTDTNNNENSPLIERDKIAYTPFWIVGNNDIGYKVTWGKYTFMDEPAKTMDDAFIWFEQHQWEITMHLIAIGFKISEDALKSKKEHE